MRINQIIKNTYFRYLIVGGLTTMISISSYFVFRAYFVFSVSLSTLLSWISAILFAYITNKKYVFHVSRIVPRSTIAELISFYASRLLTGFFELLIMFVFVQWLHLNEVFFRLLTNALTIMLNFFLSKYVVFRSKQ